MFGRLSLYRLSLIRVNELAISSDGLQLVGRINATLNCAHVKFRHNSCLVSREDIPGQIDSARICERIGLSRRQDEKSCIVYHLVGGRDRMRNVVRGEVNRNSTLLNLAGIRDCPEISERCWSSTRIDVRLSWVHVGLSGRGG